MNVNNNNDDDDDEDDSDCISEDNKVETFAPLFRQGFEQLHRLTAELMDLKIATRIVDVKPGSVNIVDVLAAISVNVDDLLHKVEKSKADLQTVKSKLFDNPIDETIAEEVLAILDNMLITARDINDASTRYNAIRQKIIETN